MVGDVVLRAFPGRLVNIHPALRPTFPGLPDQQMDHGPIIAPAPLPVLDRDTEESSSERLLAEEHRLYPLAPERLARRELRIEGRRVIGGLP